MKKPLWLGIALTAACLIACGSDSGTSSQDQKSSEGEVSEKSDDKDNSGTEDDSGKVDVSSSSAKQVKSKSSSSSADSEIQSSDDDSESDSEADKVWSWDTPKENFLNPNTIYGTFVDSKRDHKTYKTIKPYSQVWFAQNLDYEMEGSWCFDNDSKKCDLVGRLYTWDAAMKACPEGWHLPSDEEWKYVIGNDESVAGTRLKSATGWTMKMPDRYVGYNGENSLGFSAIPAGFWNDDSEEYVNGGSVTAFWSSTEKNSDEANMVLLSSVEEKVLAGQTYKKSYALSVRCVQDQQD